MDSRRTGRKSDDVEIEGEAPCSAVTRSEAVLARSENRFDRETAKYGKPGAGYLDGAWFLATSKKSASYLDKSALADESRWAIIALDAIGPILGQRRLRPYIYLQVRGKYLHAAVDMDGQPTVQVHDDLMECLRDLGIALEKPLRLPSDIEQMKRWA